MELTGRLLDLCREVAAAENLDAMRRAVLRGLELDHLGLGDLGRRGEFSRRGARALLAGRQGVGCLLRLGRLLGDLVERPVGGLVPHRGEAQAKVSEV